MSVNIIDDGGLGLIEKLTDQYNKLQADLTALIATFNAHVHQTPGATYAQNANTTVPTTLEGAATSDQINKII